MGHFSKQYKLKSIFLKEAKFKLCVQTSDNKTFGANQGFIITVKSVHQ